MTSGVPRADGSSRAASQTKAAHAAGTSAKEATEALRWLTVMGADERAVAHRVAAIMTGKNVSSSDWQESVLFARTLDPGGMLFLPGMEQKLAFVEGVARSLGPAAFIKLIPFHQDLHRHVAVLLPEYDSSVCGTAFEPEADRS